ncbi:MAG TPA: hypothetical protein VK808_04625 [Bacteroidia bacterium]|nr:hypothetical protein [Bacteroidia bacterium]
MNKQKNALFKGSKETAQRLAKEAIQSGYRIEEERTLPIYIVISSNDKNDDIFIIHPAYPIVPFQNSQYTGKNTQSDKSEPPVDKPVRPIKGKDKNMSSNNDGTGDKKPDIT